MKFRSPSDTSIDIVDNLISITRLVGEHFWPHSSSPTSANNHMHTIQNLIEEQNITKDLAAFCYIFSILLLLTSPEAIWNREEEVRKLTSDIVDILNRDTDLLQNSTPITFWQLDWAEDTLQAMQDQYHGGAVDSNLVTKLRELRNSVSRQVFCRP